MAICSLHLPQYNLLMYSKLHLSHLWKRRDPELLLKASVLLTSCFLLNYQPKTANDLLKLQTKILTQLDFSDDVSVILFLLKSKVSRKSWEGSIYF